jgi:2-(3-amino-3-carboxypropyl)histidine synthase
MKINIESDYDLELERVISEIKKQKSKLVCIQLPDGLKQKATEIADVIEENTSAEVLIWFGTCFGACDVPNLDKLKPKVDLLIQWGHTKWKPQ